MSKFLVKSIFLVALFSNGATMLFGGLVDTEGNAATNETFLGDIDMGVGTLWDLKNFIFPYDTNAIPYSAISGKPDLSGYATKTEVFNAADQGTNYTDKIAGEFEDGTRTAFHATSAGDAGSAYYSSIAFAVSDNKGETEYTASQLIEMSTNVAQSVVGEFAATGHVASATSATTATSATSAGELTGGWTSSVLLSTASNTAESVAAVASSGKQDKLPYLTNAIPYSVITDAPEGMTTNNVKDIVTNTVVVGYSDWTYTGDTYESQSYSITQAQSGDNYVFTLWDTKTSTALGTATTSELNPLSLSFSVTGGTIVATRSPLIRNALGLARYADVQALDDKIENMDTSYYRVVGITNKNQSVQFVETDVNTTSLQILMPESGMTKDWLVYIKALTNLTLVLPPADYWVVNESVTNEIPPLVPTALYFSQIADNTYSIGRQELVPITVLSQRQIENNLIRAKMKKAGMLSRSTKKSNAPSKVLTK